MQAAVSYRTKQVPTDDVLRGANANQLFVSSVKLLLLQYLWPLRNEVTTEHRFGFDSFQAMRLAVGVCCNELS